jgi:homoserine O-acetyltransferase
MLTLEFVSTFPDFADGAISMLAAGRTPGALMANMILRQWAIMNDPDWQGGDYYNTGRYPTKGVALALGIMRHQ